MLLSFPPIMYSLFKSEGRRLSFNHVGVFSPGKPSRFNFSKPCGRRISIFLYLVLDDTPHDILRHLTSEFLRLSNSLAWITASLPMCMLNRFNFLKFARSDIVGVLSELPTTNPLSTWSSVSFPIPFGILSNK
ncbi:hypothetical protein V8G54_031709 [Vigna mungo]|uniref:Uncharacterized protein n=1 Tax=Vigna mungo TaxID=3915 RepID=A0AAQ3RG22_VIGMU